MRKLCAEIVPENFNDDQEARRNEMSVEMLELLGTAPDFLNRFITEGESWFFEYDPETKRQSEWRTSQDRRKLASTRKLSFLFNSRDVVRKKN
jgi:hypothetical protein